MRTRDNATAPDDLQACITRRIGGSMLHRLPVRSAEVRVQIQQIPEL
ncbi:hypothetical protein ABIE49_001326 [Bradyrhizobium sp. OAE829]